MSKEVYEEAEKRFNELSYKGWDWRSFINGYLEGYIKATQEGEDEKD